MVNTLEGRGKSWLTVLDRADGANQPKTMQTALNTKRWTAFAFNRIANKSSYQGSMLYFNGPTTEVKGTPSGSGCYVTGFAPTLNGTRTDKAPDCVLFPQPQAQTRPYRICQGVAKSKISHALVEVPFVQRVIGISRDACGSNGGKQAGKEPIQRDQCH